MFEKLSLAVIYIAMIVVGLGAAIFLILIGSFFGGDVDGIDHVDAGGVDAGHLDLSGVEGADLSGADHTPVESGGSDLGMLKFLSPSFLSIMMAMTGAFGLFFLSIRIPAPYTVPLALISSFGVSTVISRLLYRFVRPTSMVRSIRRFEGMEGVVTLEIGPGDKLGEIEIIAEGKRYTLLAKAFDKGHIPKGSPVKVLRIATNLAIVKPLSFEGK